MAPKPNILMIQADQLSALALGCYGHPVARTPAIDGLSRPGLRFRHAVAPSPITLTSHATILTGLYPPSHGARYNGTFRLQEQYLTLAEVLRSHGSSGVWIEHANGDRRLVPESWTSLVPRVPCQLSDGRTIRIGPETALGLARWVAARLDPTKKDTER